MGFLCFAFFVCMLAVEVLKYLKLLHNYDQMLASTVWSEIWPHFGKMFLVLNP